MSDTSGGEGWWQASDGKWYRPELHPDHGKAAIGEPAAAADDAPAGSAAPDPAAPQGEPAAAAVGAASTRSGPNKKVLIVAVLAVVALVVGFLVLRSGDKGSSDAVKTGDKTSTDANGTSSDDSSSTATDERPANGIEVPSGFTLAQSEPVGVKLKALDNAQMIGVYYQLTVEEAGLVNSISLPSATARQVLQKAGAIDYQTTVPAGQVPLVPAKGEKFLVIRYQLKTSSSYSYSDKVELAADVDGVKTPIEVPSGSSAGTSTWVQAVDANAKDTGLNVHDPETNETMDLATGKLRSGYPEVLYRDPSVRSLAINQTITLPFTYSRTDYATCDGPGRTDIALGKGELVWSGAESNIASSDAVGHPNDPSQALLIVEITAMDSSGSGGCNNWRPKIPASQITVVLSDGTSVADSSAPDHSRDGYLLFTVPADVTKVTLNVKPGDGIRDASSSDGTGSYNYGGAVGSVDIVLEATSGSGSSTSTTTAGGN